MKYLLDTNISYLINERPKRVRERFQGLAASEIGIQPSPALLPILGVEAFGEPAADPLKP